MRGRWVVRGLGLVSVAMSLTLLAPGRAAQLFGIGRRPWLMAAIGCRDLAIGVGLLRSRRPARWLRIHSLVDLVDATGVAIGMIRGEVAPFRGVAWLVFALASGWAALGEARASQ